MVFTCCNTAADAVHDKAKSAKAKYLKSMSAPAADLITGVLKLDIIAGRNLPNVDVNLLRRKNKSGKLDVSDPYVTVDTVARGKKTARLIKTSVINDDLNPTWRESFNISVCHEADSLFFAVKDLDLMATDFMGSMSIRIEDVLAEKELKGWYPLQGKSGKPAGELEIHLRFVSADELTATNEVPDVIFPLRSGCGYRPYQDAHTPKVSPITDVVARDGKPYDPPQLWIDTERAIKDAKKFIYIWGWAVWAELELVREDDSQKKWETLGEILKKKAKEGVRVLIMVWDEFMSTDVNPVGLMGTHDEQTEAYFKGTGVTVFKCPREKSGHAAKMGDAFMAKTTYSELELVYILAGTIISFFSFYFTYLPCLSSRHSPQLITKRASWSMPPSPMPDLFPKVGASLGSWEVSISRTAGTIRPTIPSSRRSRPSTKTTSTATSLWPTPATPDPANPGTTSIATTTARSLWTFSRTLRTAGRSRIRRSRICC